MKISGPQNDHNPTQVTQKRAAETQNHRDVQNRRDTLSHAQERTQQTRDIEERSARGRHLDAKA